MNRVTFEATAKRIRPKIVQVGRDFFGSDEDAEDVAQEVLATLWQRCELLDEGRNVEALAMRMAKWCCINMVRNKKLLIVRAEEEDVAHQMESQPSPHEIEEAKEREAALQAAKESLGKRERQLFEMRQEEGLDAEEIAQRTGIGKQSVLSMIAMARKKLYNEIMRRTNL